VAVARRHPAPNEGSSAAWATAVRIARPVTQELKKMTERYLEDFVVGQAGNCAGAPVQPPETAPRNLVGTKTGDFAHAGG
jgi:hypothetical protein